MTHKVWFITGCSKGLGKTLVKKLLERGDYVCATSRNKDQLTSLFGDTTDHFLPLSLNLSDDDAVRQAIDQCHHHFGRIDVLVNNAGFLRSGAVEEVSDQEVRASFDVNVFAVLNTIRHVLPYMRKQQSGHIMNTSSIAGSVVFALGSTYSAAKFAINAISSAVAQEVKAFNIHVTNLVLGYFRTDFLDASSYLLSYKKMGPYHELNEKHLKSILDRNHQQIGDPEKAIDTYIKLAYMENPPYEIALGSDAYRILNTVHTSKLEQLEANKAWTLSTDYDD